MGTAPTRLTPAKSIGGRLHGSGTRLGPQDGYTLWEGPDNVSTAAVALAIGAGGALNPMETTVPLAVDETLDALRRAQQVCYRPPGT
jgi:uncharacterized protein with GYD domain